MYIKLKDGKSKVVTLSYDDGVIFDKRLIEIMDKNGIKGTFNINANLYQKEGKKREQGEERLMLSEAKELYIGSPHEVAVHGYNHTFLELSPESEVIYEISRDRESLEKTFGTIIRGMAYPYGTYSDAVIECLKRCGIVYSRTVESTGKFTFPENWLKWHPTCHHIAPNLMELAQKFAENKSRYPMRNEMFYLWGHSYEFDRQDNWHIIEEFCEYMGGRDDIWYATNIEIYDYFKAYNSLEVSFDGNIVHNPTCTDVWFMHDYKTYVVRGGETINLSDK